MNGWKVVAWIFIILFILETVGLAFLIKLGMDTINEEKQCALNICQNNGYEAYLYDSTSKMCSCYKNNEIAYQEILP